MADSSRRDSRCHPVVEHCVHHRYGSRLDHLMAVAARVDKHGVGQLTYQVITLTRRHGAPLDLLGGTKFVLVGDRTRWRLNVTQNLDHGVGPFQGTGLTTCRTLCWSTMDSSMRPLSGMYRKTRYIARSRSSVR